MLTASKKLDLRKAKILVVDDNPLSSDLITQILLGFRVRTPSVCRSAAEGRERVGAERFDLLLVDSEMSEEDGFSLVHFVRAANLGLNFTTPIVLVSAHTPVSKVMTARDAGANMVIKKPISPTALLSRIEWLARCTREFIDAPTYRGPDRRFRHGPLPEGVTERRAEALALTATPDRALSQDEVDSLFG